MSSQLARSARALEVRPGDDDARAGHAAGVDQPLDVEVGVRLEGAGGARGGDAGGEIEAREAEAMLDIHRDASAAGIEEMLVHADQSGDDGLAGEIDDARTGRHCGAAEMWP